ncbi:MAG: EscU/YscU/HrcU family type III secretion system export apparatus switch protein [Rubrivivax sp.]|nr:EscU/YscU/HrcU family type III secretion system export apparatus switch protein [Rubrivivax sp.]
MSGDSSEEKTEEPSAKRLEDARKKGQVPKSEDLSSSLSMLAALLCVMALIPYSARELADLFLAIERLLPTLDAAGVKTLVLQALLTVAQLSAGPVVVASVVHTATLFLQTGAVFSIDPMLPKMEKLNPADNLKLLFSIKTAVQFAQISCKLIVIGIAVWLVFIQALPDAIRVIHGDVGAALVVARSSLMHMLLWCGAFFVFLGAADLGYHHWQHLRDNRMSISEVKRELRDDEGDGMQKAERNRVNQEPPPEVQLGYMRLARLVLHHTDGRIVVLTHLPKAHRLPLYILRGRGAFAARALALARERKLREVGDDMLVNRLFGVAESGAPVAEDTAEALMVFMR